MANKSLNVENNHTINHGTKGSYPNGGLIIQINFDGASGTQIDFTGKNAQKIKTVANATPAVGRDLSG